MTPHIDLTPDEINICHQTNTSIKDAKYLKALTGRSIELLEFDTDYGKATQSKGVFSYIDSDMHDSKGKLTVLGNYERFQSEGKLLFLGDWELLNNKLIEDGLPSETGGWCEMIGLLSTTADPIEAVKLYETCWGNCSITTESLINKVNEWNRKFGLKVYHITFDSFTSQILNKEAVDYFVLATEIHKMCADAGNTETTIEENAEQIRKSGEIFLWWD
jgi:hypothetical protein